MTLSFHGILKSDLCVNKIKTILHSSYIHRQMTTQDLSVVYFCIERANPTPKFRTVTSNVKTNHALGLFTFSVCVCFCDVLSNMGDFQVHLVEISRKFEALTSLFGCAE